MATDHTPSGRRPHYHRGRRGTDRRGTDRRSTQPPDSPRPSGEQVNLRWLYLHLISPQQIQDLAGRRLEAILDPRTINPTLFDQLRRSAAMPADAAPISDDAKDDFDATAEYDAGSGFVGFIRRLLKKALAPLFTALDKQQRLNEKAAARAAEIERRQTEWNALHYQVLQRLVTEVSRASIEVQSYGARIESLGARVDFNDRRLRAVENAPAPQRSQRPVEPALAQPAAASTTEAPQSPRQPDIAPSAGGSVPGADAPRRRRRRRRGRRGTAVPGEAAGVTAQPDALDDTGEMDGTDDDSGSDQELGDLEQIPDSASADAAPVLTPGRTEESTPPQPDQQTAPSGAGSVTVLPSPSPAPDEPAAVPPSVPADPGPPER